MRKLALHLAIACVTFAVGAYITNIWNSMFVEVPIQTSYLPISGSSWLPSTAESELLEIYHEYPSAQTNHDVAFFERVEADDFVLFPRGDKALSRSEDIELLKSFPKDIVYTHEDLKIETYGDAAIVSGRMRATYKSGFSHSWRWIDVCLKREGRWQIQSTTQVD